MSSNKDSLNTSKKVCGHLPNEIWDKFTKGDEIYKGYYAVTCNYYSETWSSGRSKDLKKHLTYECQNIDSETMIETLTLLTYGLDSDDEMSIIKSKKKQRLPSNIDKPCKNISTSLDKADQINKALVKLVSCCNIPFALVEHPFFYDFIKILWSTYSLPSRWILFNTLFDQELARINLKVERIISKEINLTIIFDG
ncbi:3772_t:CDS:1 [Cetraspora pellucida]|uniref:3772_t:CDS:1 n=1 Tax=Cetraspora pellucida TaxID=1433469 RepID=A0ACA9KLI3_9GLOM|nr:3772_t:CDS:1 [Cetraspora pellucida]